MIPKLYICESADKCSEEGCKHKTPHTTATLCNNPCNIGEVVGAKCIEFTSVSEVVKSTWYSEDTPVKGDLDLSKPIMCQSDSSKYLYLLIPQIASNKKMRNANDPYKIIGYNWLNIKNGTYNSCAFFKTIKEAVQSRYGTGYTLFNYEFTLPTNLGE